MPCPQAPNTGNTVLIVMNHMIKSYTAASQRGEIMIAAFMRRDKDITAFTVEDISIRPITMTGTGIELIATTILTHPEIIERTVITAQGTQRIAMMKTCIAQHGHALDIT
jgi:hypothetical protein